MRHTPSTAAPGAPSTTPARTGRGGGTHATSAEKSRGFDQLVDRLADPREEPAADARGSRASIAAREDAGVEARSPEPRAKDKDDADPAAAPASEPAAPAAPQTPFPWTLPLNPALWTLEPATDAGGDADAGQQTDDAAASASVTAASAATVGVGLGTTHVAGALSASLAAGATTSQGVAGAGDANANEDGAAAFDATLDQRSRDGIGASVAGAVVDAPADAQAHAEIGVGVTFATEANDGHGVGTGETRGAAQVHAQAAETAADTLSLSASLDASGGARAVTAADGARIAATLAATLDGAGGASANGATADANTDASAAASAAALAGQVDATAGAGTDAAAGVDRARQQAMQELWRAMARANAGGHTSAADAQGSVDGSMVAEGAIAASTNAAAAVTAVTDRDTLLDAGAVSVAGDAVAAQTQEAGPRAKKASKAEGEIDANAGAAAPVADAASAEHVAGASTNGSSTSGNGHGANGRGRDAHPENFGGLVSSLRHASDGGVHGLSPAFEARSLMASAIDGGVDVHDASATAASTTILTTAPPEEQAAQIVRSMRLHWRGSVGEAQLRLTPEHLGQVLVNVRVDQGSVTATMHAETPAAQQWIQAHQQQLRDALDAQGLRVEQLKVTTDPEDRPRRDHAEQQEKPRGRAQTRTRDGDAPRFEIRM